MKNFKGKILKKIIPVFLVFIFLFNFIMPNYVYADTWEDIGGVLFKPIKLLVCAIGDAVVKTLQNIFVTAAGTEIRAGDDASGISYAIRYSPGIIFSGKVNGLDINFINPDQPTDRNYYKWGWTEIGRETPFGDPTQSVEKILKEKLRLGRYC